jgi:hypothetical protein
MIVLASFFILLIIFLVSIFYGTFQEGFGVNDYHWAKNQYGKWTLQKRNSDTNVVNEDEFQDELSLEDIPADGVIPEGYIKFGEKMLKMPENVQQDMIEQQIVEKKPLVKQPIPASGVIPRGSYKINQFEMAVIPDAYYIYDQDTMAEIPDGYQAAEDKTYIFKTSADLQKQIDRADSYNVSDFSAYRDNNSINTSDPNTSAIYKSQPASRDPRQFLLDGQASSMTGDETYINSVIDRENPALRDRGTSGAGSDYRASPSYSFYDNHTIINTTNLKNTPGMLGGFCTQNAHSKIDIEKKCSTLGKDVCASTNCCVLLGNETCVAGNEHGPSYQDHYRNPLIRDRDYYYYKGKCHGNCKHH